MTPPKSTSSIPLSSSIIIVLFKGSSRTNITSLSYSYAVGCVHCLRRSDKNLNQPPLRCNLESRVTPWLQLSINPILACSSQSVAEWTQKLPSSVSDQFLTLCKWVIWRENKGDVGSSMTPLSVAAYADEKSCPIETQWATLWEFYLIQSLVEFRFNAQKVILNTEVVLSTVRGAGQLSLAGPSDGLKLGLGILRFPVPL
jgi:hypothetical protein